MADRKILIVVEGRDNASGPLRGVGGALSNIAQIAAGILSAQLFENIARGIFSISQEALESIASYERLGATLQTLTARELVNTGQALDMASALEMAKDQAKELLDWTQELAIKSPFTQQGVADAFKTALAYNFTTEQAKRLTQATIDFAAGSGAGEAAMNQISLALGQIQAKGKLSGQEILQLVNAGIPVTSILAKAFGKSTAEIMKMTEQGLIPADAAIEAIIQSLENDFGGAAERQSTTWAGLMGTFEDIKQIALREFFGGVAEAIQPIAVELAEWLQGPGIEKLKEWGAVVGEVAGYFINLGSALFETGDIFSSEFLEALTSFLPQEMQGKVFEFVNGIKSTFESLQPAFTNFQAFWIVNGPAITQTIEATLGRLITTGKELFDKILPFLIEKFYLLSEWFFVNGPLISNFVSYLGMAFSHFIQVVAGMWQFIEPILGGLIDLILGLAKTIMQIATGDWAGAWETIKQTALNVVLALGNGILGFLNWIANIMGSSLSQIGAVWKNNWEMFKNIVSIVFNNVVTVVREKIASVVSTFNGIVSAIQGAIEWVRKLASSFASLVIPSWLTPGSPTPLEIGLLGINKAMSKVASNALPAFSDGFSAMIPNSPISNGAALATGASGGSVGAPIQLVYAPTFSMADENEFYNRIIPFLDKYRHEKGNG